MPLFKKLAFFTDIHFGRRSNSPVDLKDNLDFVRWFIAEAKSRNCETFIFGGDFFDNRNAIHLSTLNSGLEALQMLNDAFEKCYFIPGNHDLLFRTSRDVSSIEFARNLPNIEIIREPTTIDGVTFLPWLIGDEHKSLKGHKGRYVFAHLEVPGFLMNAKVEMPEGAHAIKADLFDAHEFVFTGHFHLRQRKGNIIYTGNVMPFNFSDNWDDDRGAMFLDWDGQPEFASWPDQPLFRTMKLSELLETPDQLLAPKLTARVAIDIDISYEEAQLIKDTFVTDFGLRRIELVHQQKQEADQEFTGEVAFQSVDQIVIDGLTAVQSIGLKSAKLVEIYKNLPSA